MLTHTWKQTAIPEISLSGRRTAHPQLLPLFHGLACKAQEIGAKCTWCFLHRYLFECCYIHGPSCISLQQKSVQLFCIGMTLHCTGQLWRIVGWISLYYALKIKKPNTTNSKPCLMQVLWHHSFEGSIFTKERMTIQQESLQESFEEKKNRRSDIKHV